MIQHYLTVAFRNMRKYKSQTLISVAGLATGFACFAMATLWIRYEMTYDSFHKNAGRIYCVNTTDLLSITGMSRNNAPYSLAGYFKFTYPEIVNATAIRQYPFYFDIEGIQHNADILIVDSSFFSMFDVKLVEGSMDFLIPDSKKLAITRQKALQLFGNASPLGKEIKGDNSNDYTICAVITGFPKRSNYPFDFLSTHNSEAMRLDYPGNHTLVEIMSGADIEAFKQKLYESGVPEKYTLDISKITLTLLTSVRYEDQNIERDIKFQHIILFAVAGSLLILCTLFNYLTLFISRFRIRQKELALRIVYGASGRSLFAMLSVEFVLSLIVALILGLIFINIANSSFRAVSEVKLELSEIYLESIVYIAAIIAIALAVFLLTIAIFRRRTLNANIRSNRKMFRKTSIVVQLIISIVFAFCTLILLKQMYYLRNTDLGFAVKNRGSAYVWAKYEQIKILNDKIKQIPEIEETFSGYIPLLMPERRMVGSIHDWDGKQENAETIYLNFTFVSEQYVKHYEMELVEGEFLSDNDGENAVMLNETAAKTFGWDKAAGKSIDGKRVKGVVKNIYNSSPTIAVKPCCYMLYPVYMTDHYNQRSFILFKYQEGTWKTCRNKINKIITEEFPNDYTAIYNDEDEYDEYLKSEKALLAILTIVSLICVVICVFGFVSMISLTCEERRKEIAIRKINGATIKDILDIFFKEYLTLLVTGSIIAFPVGYIVMKRWLEQYVVQTEISAWVYLSILLALIMAIVFCVGGRVYKTSSENPVKSIM